MVFWINNLNPSYFSSAYLYSEWERSFSLLAVLGIDPRASCVFEERSTLSWSPRLSGEISPSPTPTLSFSCFFLWVHISCGRGPLFCPFMPSWHVCLSPLVVEENFPDTDIICNLSWHIFCPSNWKSSSHFPKASAVPLSTETSYVIRVGLPS